jgi:ABC-type polysaccharide/polyol phosphate export permease
MVLLMKSLVDKDLRVRYKRSLLGFLWFLLKPLFSMAVYTVVFTRIIRFGGAIQHFSLFLLAGLLPWNFLSSSLSASTRALLDNHRLIRSVYFPRAALPVAAVLANGVHMILALGVLEALLWIWGHPPGPPLLALVPGALMLCCLTSGLAMALSVWNVYYRDVSQFLEVVLLAWFYASPVIYPLDRGMIPSGVEAVLRYNPVAGILEIFHGAMYYGRWPETWCWVGGAAWSLAFLALGVVVFRRREASVVKEL